MHQYTVTVVRPWQGDEAVVVNGTVVYTYPDDGLTPQTAQAVAQRLAGALGAQVAELDLDAQDWTEVETALARVQVHRFTIWDAPLTPGGRLAAAIIALACSQRLYQVYQNWHRAHPGGNFWGHHALSVIPDGQGLAVFLAPNQEEGQ